MKYKIHSHGDLVLLGQTAVILLMEGIVKERILEDSCNELANLGHTGSTEDMSFETEFDFEKDSRYLLYHLIAVGTTMLELYCTDYIAKKKFFGGYQQDPIAAMSFIKGLENEINDFKQKEEMADLQIIVFNDKMPPGGKYSYGEKLSAIRFPYFSPDGCSEESFMDTFYNFAVDISFIRRPKKPSAIYLERFGDLKEISLMLLNNFFID